MPEAVVERDTRSLGMRAATHRRARRRLLRAGFRATDVMATIGFAALMAVPILATMRNRQGLALALDYLSRVYLPDPSDEIHGGRELSESEAAALQG